MANLAQIPAVVGQHLDAIELGKDGDLFLASSQLSYRYWNGSLWRFADSSNAPDVEKCDAGKEIECGIHDIKLIPGTNRLLAGLDSGGVQLLEVSEEGGEFTCLARPVEHDDYVTSLSINLDYSRATSASQDNRIKVWDLQEFSSVNTFRGHYGCVYNASFHPKDSNLFVSCSQDGNILLWDLRKPKPATKIGASSLLPSLPTCVEWQAASDTGIVIGTETGHVIVLDTKQSSQAPLQLKPHSRPVKRISFCPQNASWFATCSEDSTAVVTEYTAGSASPIFRVSEHTDFVQGMAWHPDGRLFTCGWDKRVVASCVKPNMGLTEAELVQGTQAVRLYPEGIDMEQSDDEQVLEENLEKQS